MNSNALNGLLRRTGMIVIAVCQQKGGVGKTTLSRTIGEFFSLKRDLRVLLLDIDPQASLSKLMLHMDDAATDAGARPPRHPDFDPGDPEWEGGSGGRSSTANIWLGGPVFPYEVEWPAHPDNTFDILPADADRLTRIAQHELTPLAGTVVSSLRDYLSGSAASELYDLLVIDTPPSKSVLTRAALHAATHLVIPLAPSQQCIDGLAEMMTLHRNENTFRTFDEALEIAAIQWNLVKRSRKTDSFLIEQTSAMPGIKPYISPVLLTDRSQFADRDIQGLDPRSIFNLGPKDPARRMAEEFCCHLESQLVKASRGKGGVYAPLVEGTDG